MLNTIRKTKILIPALYFFCASFASGQTKKALIIGINEYERTSQTPSVYTTSRAGWHNLDGAVNDANAMKEVIINRFGFDEKNIVTVFNKEATNERIKKEIQNLADHTRKGDIIFFYYAGHGSQVKNSKEVDGTGKDQTIVPTDFIDIRNKENAALFNKLVDAGADLTLIFDCCHSGAIARGTITPSSFKDRDLPAVSDSDYNDASAPPSPSDHGALLISASQRDQKAKEKTDDNGIPHGAFTLALVRAINASPVNESAEHIFMRAKAIMQSSGSSQEPVLEAINARKKETLLGEEPGLSSGKTFIPVLKIEGRDVILQGGYASGLNKKCRLKGTFADGDSAIIEITEVLNIGKSKAKVVTGDIHKIKTGSLFECIVWATPDKPNLRIWFPASGYETTDLMKLTKSILSSPASKSFQWINDPTTTSSDYVIQFYDSSWKLVNKLKNQFEDLGTNLSITALQNKIPKKSKIFLQLPPPLSLTNALKLGKNSDNSAIEITKDPALADYVLIGRYKKDSLSYALVKPGVTEDDTNYKSTLPLRSEWENINSGKTAERISDDAVKLGIINAWLNLQSPPDGGSFPFSLALKNCKTGELVTSGTVQKDEKYTFSLVTDKQNLRDKSKIESRYVYVFLIDKLGKTQLLIPQENMGNEGNHIVRQNFAAEIPLTANACTIADPLGYDTYFLLTTDEALNTNVFEKEGVRSRGLTGGHANGLTRLLQNVGARTRGIDDNESPVEWSLQRLVIRSVAAQQ